MNPKRHPLVVTIRTELTKAGDSDKAAAMQAYMKTDQKFYGVQANPRRTIFRHAKKRYPISKWNDYDQLILELWNGEYREEMYQALEIAETYKQFRLEKSWNLYEGLVRTATNWDTLDWIAAKLIGELVLEYRQFESVLKQWIEDENFWVRRAALLAHLKHKRHTNTKLLAYTIQKLAHEKEFFIRKAIGWVLRNYAYTDPAWVKRFVARNGSILSNLSIREAIKNLS
ncbi:MAG: DNA alkylation repair protein [Candidatus Neomarinimicrobiota bacterium]